MCITGQMAIHGRSGKIRLGNLVAGKLHNILKSEKVMSCTRCAHRELDRRGACWSTLGHLRLLLGAAPTVTVDTVELFFKPFRALVMNFSPLCKSFQESDSRGQHDLAVPVAPMHSRSRLSTCVLHADSLAGDQSLGRYFGWMSSSIRSYARLSLGKMSCMALRAVV